MNRIFPAIVTLIVLISCAEIRTTNPDDVYKHWSGSRVPKEIQLMKGQYWQSAHWTREYIMFLKLRPTDEWWTAFVNQNQLKIEKGNWTEPPDVPNWFDPPQHTVKYRTASDFDQGSRYFMDTLTQECYIYEIQL